MESVELVQGDITTIDAECIVNAANRTLLGGGGVDGAIHRAAGPKLLEECKTLGGCSVGGAKLTKGYQLKAEYVIHTVGPIYRDGAHAEKELLESCYRESLLLADQNKIESMAFPSISTGAYKFPIHLACPIALTTTKTTLPQLQYLKKIFFVLFSSKDFGIYQKELENLTE